MNALLPALFLLAVQPPAQPNAPSKEFLAARQHIQDLSLLQSLIPVKLTTEQIDQLLPLLKAASAQVVKLDKQDDDALKAILDELAKAREATIGGAAVPQALENKVNELRRQTDTRRAEAQRKVVADVLGILRESLTETQKAEIEKQSVALFGGKRVPKQYASDPSKAPKSVVQDLAITAYIERVLLFDRTIVLLNEIKATAKPPRP